LKYNLNREKKMQYTKKDRIHQLLAVIGQANVVLKELGIKAKVIATGVGPKYRVEVFYNRPDLELHPTLVASVDSKIKGFVEAIHRVEGFIKGLRAIQLFNAKRG
jgi:hypothetical protein